MCAKSFQLCPIPCDPMNCSPPGSSVCGILQSRILEWVAMPSSRGSSPPRDQTHVSCISCIVGRFFTREAQSVHQFSSVQSLSRVQLFATPWIAARQASLSITSSRSLLKLMPIESVMPSSHLILCRPLLLLPPIPPSIRVFSNESTLCLRWPEYWSFSFSISPSNEHPGLNATIQKKKGKRKLMEVMDIFIILILVMFSWVYASLQTHQIVYIKYIQKIVYQLYLNIFLRNPS